MEFNDVQRLSLDDIVFSGRNKSYGGYALRQIYGKNVIRGAVGGIILAGLLLTWPLISAKLSGMFEKEKHVYKSVELAELPPLDRNMPPPPPPPPPTKPQIKFVAITVTIKEIPKEQPPLPPDPPKNVDIGTQDIKGDPNVKTYVKPVEAPPPPPPKEPEPEKPKEDLNKVFVFVEQKPEFPNGEAAMMRFLRDNIKYPAIARENNIDGTVYIGFVVNTDGSIQDVTVKRGVGGGCSEEALRVVGQMPKWTPGRQQGRPVRVAYTLPVKFKLD